MGPGKLISCDAMSEESEGENQTLNSNKSTSSTDSVIDLGSPLNHQPVSKVKELLQKLLEAQTMMDDDKVFLYAVYYAQ